VRFRGAPIAVAAVAALSLLLAPAALAATEVGTECEANQLNGQPRTLLSLAHPASNPAPVTIPHAGVITGWRSRESGETQTVTRMKVVRPVRVEGATHFKVISQSDPASLLPGLNRFSTRISVQAGDLIGLSGGAPEHGSAAPMCEEVGGEVLALEGDPAVGVEVNPEPGQTTEQFGFHQVPLVANLEPDIDGDGFGDETQDLCAQNPNIQAACPRPSLLLRGTARSRSAILFVSCSAQARIQVSASVKVGGRRLRLNALPQDIGAGDDARFVLHFSARLRRALSRLRPKHWLRLHVAVTATNNAGEFIEGQLGLKLTGRSGRRKAARWAIAASSKQQALNPTEGTE
jgi:hypothetical protein